MLTATNSISELASGQLSCTIKSVSVPSGFRWNEFNIEHVVRHGVSLDEAEFVVRRARRPYPRRIEDSKWIVWGPGNGDRPLQIVFVLDHDREIAYIIHARPLNEREKRRFRRQRRS